MVVGYSKQWEFLKKTQELGKTPHALLFCGQDSIGQKALALEFIKLLNCQALSQGLGGGACQKCRACQDIEKKVHPDLFIIKPEENKEIKISQIRALHSQLSLRAYSAPFKAVIIDQAHCLNQQAQSAFLKLLEEPKGKTIFILITQYPEMLLLTILSRVERLRFYSLAPSCPKEKTKELLELSRSDLVQRFHYAKKLSEEQPDLKVFLAPWLAHFREMFIATVNGQSQDYSLTKLSRILKLIQTTDFLITTTNINRRLALEILMIEF